MNLHFETPHVPIAVDAIFSPPTTPVKGRRVRMATPPGFFQAK